MADTRFEWERALRGDASVTGGLMLVLLTFATYTNKGGIGYPGADRLAAAVGLSNSTVRRHLTDAARRGWLERETRGGRRGDGTSIAARYRLSQPPTGEQLSDGVNRSLHAPQPLTGDASTAHPSARITSKNMTKEARRARDPFADLEALLASTDEEAS